MLLLCFMQLFLLPNALAVHHSPACAGNASMCFYQNHSFNTDNVACAMLEIDLFTLPPNNIVTLFNMKQEHCSQNLTLD